MLKADNRLEVEIIVGAAAALTNRMAFRAVVDLPKPALFSRKRTSPNRTEFCFKVKHV